MADYLGIGIGHTVIVGLLFLSGFFFCCASFCFVRMKSDPERRGMHFAKVAWVFFQFYCFFDIVAHIITLVLYGMFSERTPELVRLVFGVTADFFGFLANIFVFLALVRLSSGVLRASRPAGAGGVGATLPRVIGWVAYGLAAIMVVLVIAQWGLWLDYYVGLINNVFSIFSGTVDLLDKSMSAAKLNFAVTILLFIAALLALPWAIAAFMLTLSKPKDGSVRRMVTPATYLFVGALLFLVARVYKLAEFATIFDVSTLLVKSFPNYLPITEAVFYSIAIYIALVLIFVLARIPDASGGLWSVYAPSAPQAQHWTPGAPWPPAGGYAQQPYQPPFQPQQQPPLQPPPQQLVPKALHSAAPTPPSQSISPAPVPSSPPTEPVNAHHTTTPPIDAAPPLQVPTPDPTAPRAVEHPVGSTELPLTHPQTEWELPTNAPGSGAREAEAAAAQ